MLKLKKLIKTLKIRYYEFMMADCIDQFEIANLEYDETHQNCTKWIKRYEKFKAKLDKISMD